MKNYTLLKLNQWIKNFRIKFFGLLVFHVLKKRYLAVHLDPVNACNLRCKMCYFTDKEYVKKLKGVFTNEEISLIGEAFLDRAIKLQIGCGTEPTLFKDVSHIIKTAKKHQVPYISLITNANTLEEEKLSDWLANGLDEIIISLHGVTKETYEDMMGRGNFERFMESLQLISKLKKQYAVTLRINYTFNEDNFEELNQFFEVFNDIKIDVFQIRPIVKIGETEYNNFSLEKVKPIYDEVHSVLKEECKKRGITLMSHNPKQLSNRVSLESVIKKYVYCYISPTHIFREDFNWKQETYDEYATRVGIKEEIIKDIFSSKKRILEYADDKLNYEIN